MKRKYRAKVIRTTVYTGKLNAVSYAVANLLLTIALVSTGILYDSLSDFMTRLQNNSIPSRTLMINQYEKDLPEEVTADRICQTSPYILTAAHQNSVIGGGNIASLASEGMNGDVIMLGCDETTMPALTAQTDFSMTENFCIIPERFYPDSFMHSIDKAHYIDGADYIGRELTLTVEVDHFDGKKFYTIDHADFKFRVVGTYDADAVYNNDNVCYIPFSLAYGA